MYTLQTILHFSELVLQKRALERYEAVCKQGAEKLVSGSDDFTLFLWLPEKEKRPMARMTGHQQLINDVKFSPDTRFIISYFLYKMYKSNVAKSGPLIQT